MKIVNGFIYSFFCLVLAVLVPACDRPFPGFGPGYHQPTPTVVPVNTPGCNPEASVGLHCGLDQFQQASARGGILNLGTGGTPILPLALPGVGLNPAKAARAPYQTGQALQQLGDFTNPADSSNPLPHLTTPLITQGTTWGGTAILTSAAWAQSSTLPPACQTSFTVADSLGNPRQVTFLFYQVNDLGANVNSAYANPQEAWAWYAFETTGGQQPGNANLTGGSGLLEGVPGLACSANRNQTGESFAGDLLYFNADGTLASLGGVEIRPGGAIQSQARLYLPSRGGAPVLTVAVNFGTAGLTGFGLPDGLHSGIFGSFRVVNGVNSYVALSTCP